MLKHRFRASLIAILMMVSLFGQGTLVLAGTTGTLSGTVTDASGGAPLAGVKVTAVSPSQTATATTDSGGHFSILSLAPDTYQVSVQLQGYESNSSAGVLIVSDNTRELSLSISKTLRQIGRVSARSAGSLVRPGTTADVYSINANQQRTVAAAGGGGNLDSAFSALSTVPGVAVAPGQAGYIGAAATLSIRGGDYDQIGYQFDGIPVNRAFDNYPSSATSSLGQQELQVYTGAPPAGTTSEGISGYINQVIKTGTNPAFVSTDLGIGSPFYHKVNFEAGGTLLNNRLSYYVGLGGYNQTQRYINQYDGADLSNSYGYPNGLPCDLVDTGNGVANPSPAVAPSCYVNGKFTRSGDILYPITAFSQSQVMDRDSVVNLHYYFPHKDGSRDDFQALYDNSHLSTQVYSSINDLGGVAAAQGLNEDLGGPAFLANGKPNTYTYVDGYQVNLPTGGILPANVKALSSIYYFPNTDAHTFDDQINPAVRDGFNNDQSITKVQFTKSLGSAAYLRAYGYTYYSDWLNSGPNSLDSGYGAISYDYELEAHTRGAGFQFSDQLNSRNLLTLNGDYTTSHVIRDNNTEMINGEYGPNSVNSRTALAVLVSSANPTGGVCYGPTGNAVDCMRSGTGYNAYAPATADGPGNPGGAQFATLQQAYNGTVAPITAPACGAGKCEYLVVGNGQYATYNQVQPIFYGASLSDEIRPTSKLTINAGLRLDVYQYKGSDTTNSPARAFWYNAYNADECENTTTNLIAGKIALGSGAACPAGYSAVNFSNPTGEVTQTYPEFQPRLGFTYSLTPQTVIRAAYGRYTQPPNTAYEQYDALQTNAPALLYGTYGFQQYGFTTPDHPIPPAASSNYDFSLEQALPGQVSLKFTPFLRKTQNQAQQFYLNRATSFVSGLNVGNQTSQGFEFELDKGDFSRDGLSAKLSFAYTNSYIKYNNLSNGSTVLTPVINAIKTYNTFTKAGGGSPCYTVVNAATGVGGVAAPTCPAGSVANPYYNAPAQSPDAFGPGNSYYPYDTIPAGVGVSSTQYGYPYVTSLVLNEKIKRFSITPIVQFFAGQRYGTPLGTLGIDPTTCTGILGGTPATDPRYKYGSAGGSPFNAADCGDVSDSAGNVTGIPNQQSGSFDGLGAYSQPAQVITNLQLNYEVTKNLSVTANVTNLVNTCFGGSNVPWKVGGACAYGLVQNGLTGGIGNTYNPGEAIQPSERYTYQPYFIQQPIGIYVDANIKL